jgi:hypothetical protein
MRRAWAPICVMTVAATLAGPAAAQELAPQNPTVVGPIVDAPGKLPAPPPSADDLAYDARLKASFAAAETFQGPLDGGWTLTGRAGGLYAFQFTDKGDVVEGAWLDLARSGQADSSGLIDSVVRTPAGVIINFAPAGRAPVSITLHRDLQGDLVQGDQATPVTLRKAAL